VQGRGTFLTSENQRELRKKRDAFAFLAPEIREGCYPSLIHGFEQSCSGFQHQMVVGNSSNDIGRQADLLMQLMDQEVGGVALVPATSSPTPTYQLGLLQKNYIPVVCCHRTVAGITAPSVVFSGFENGQKAAQAFLVRGHRRIVYIFSHRYSMVGEREAGIRSALAACQNASECPLQMEEYGMPAPVTDPANRVAIEAALPKILSQPNRPTAIFCGSLFEAEQIYLMAGDLGLEIPRDLSLIYVGSTWREGALAGRISSVCIDEREIGARAAQLLHEMRTGKRALDNNEQIVFPTTLFVGETLGEARPAKER
jgi:DNA-binding LacI/PurR family transcriptional regulator